MSVADFSTQVPFRFRPDEPIQESAPLLVNASSVAEAGSVQHHPREKPEKVCGRNCVKAGLAVLGFWASLAMKGGNLLAEKGQSPDHIKQVGYKIDTIANVLLGVSVDAMLHEVIGSNARMLISNQVKRQIVPLFEIGTQIFVNVKQTELSRQAFFTTFEGAAGALLIDDLYTLFNIPQDKIQLRRREKAIPMLEGDAKSLWRVYSNAGMIALLGVALITVGVTVDMGQTAKSALIDAGVFAETMTLGTMLAERAYSVVERLNKKWEDDPLRSSLPTHLRIMNSALSLFQLGYPQVMAMSVVPNSAWGFGITGLLAGAGHQITRTIFQYTEPSRTVDIRLSFVERAKNVFKTRLPSIVLNGIFYATFLGWAVWGEVDGGTAIVRGVVGSLFGSAVAGELLSMLVDLGWNPSDCKTLNTLYFNFVTLSPAALVYLLLQTKFIAGDLFMDKASPVGLSFGYLATIALGAAIGQDRWQELRKERMDPALTSFLGKSLLAWTVAQKFLGKI